MTAVYFATALALLVAAAILLLRLFAGPSLYDRVLALNSFGTKTVLLICLIGFVAGRPGLFLDIALLYALINFAGTIAVLKFFRYRALGDIPTDDGAPTPEDRLGLERPATAEERAK